jgi:hypothetical protein
MPISIARPAKLATVRWRANLPDSSGLHASPADVALEAGEPMVRHARLGMVTIAIGQRPIVVAQMDVYDVAHAPAGDAPASARPAGGFSL